MSDKSKPDSTLLDTREVIISDCLVKLQKNRKKLEFIKRKFDDRESLDSFEQDILREMVSLEIHDLDILITEVQNIKGDL